MKQSVTDETTTYIDQVFERGDPRFANLDSWQTPASDYPRNESVGHATFKKFRYSGTYMGFGVHDADFVQFAKRVEITALQVRKQTWMVDDPWHYWSIQDSAAQLHGRVLVGGLGLGLVLHELARNPNVDSVLVIEREQDVIDLLHPYLPESLDLEIVNDDFYHYIESDESSFDSAFVDLWVTNGRDETRNVFYGDVLPLALRLFLRFGIQTHTLGFVGSKPLP
jgi:hypothetical protein